MEGFSLETYLSNGVERIVKGIMKASLKNPKASIFMAQHGMDSKRARTLREQAEQNGEHIPPFLIASITNQCNLHCKGCYARANKSCVDHANQAGLMSAQEWGDVFTQAEELGIEFILLAGGEPFVRKDVLEMAGEHSTLIFPIFTNGTMIEAEYLTLLEKHRNLMPVLSIEGSEQTTDDRRGVGIYQKLQDTMQTLHKKGILFGASVTVTTENMKEVLSEEFVTNLSAAGCKAVVYVEYVPMNEESRALAPGDAERAWMNDRLAELRLAEENMVFVSFPGDEKTSGGCLAAGRGFFHINANGGAEPCPFSPYSDTSVRTTPLREALHSPLFVKLQNNGNLTETHVGGCVLFEQKEQVEALLMESRS